MTQQYKITIMTHQDIAKEIISYGLNLAYFNVENIEIGFLTRQIQNALSQDEIIETSSATERILRELVGQIKQALGEEKLTDSECGTLFQYIIDKMVEVIYKVIVGQEIDTTFNVKEAFEYHEPDLPYFIQLKLTNQVGKMAIISIKTLNHIERNDYRTMDFEVWFLPYLLLASSIGMMFAQEIDLNDDSEMQHYLHGE